MFFFSLFCRKRTFGNSIRKDVGTSSLSVTVSGNSTRMNSWEEQVKTSMCRSTTHCNDNLKVFSLLEMEDSEENFREVEEGLLYSSDSCNISDSCEGYYVQNISENISHIVNRLVHQK